MNDEQKWEDPLENDGLTLGPEESLQREIKKSKSLKVDRLRLRDEIEQLKAQKKELKEKNRELCAKVQELTQKAPSILPPLKPSNKIKRELLPILIALTVFFSLLFLFRN